MSDDLSFEEFEFAQIHQWQQLVTQDLEKVGVSESKLRWQNMDGIEYPTLGADELLDIPNPGFAPFRRGLATLAPVTKLRFQLEQTELEIELLKKYFDYNVDILDYDLRRLGSEQASSALEKLITNLKKLTDAYGRNIELRVKVPSLFLPYVAYVSKKSDEHLKIFALIDPFHDYFTRHELFCSLDHIYDQLALLTKLKNKHWYINISAEWMDEVGCSRALALCLLSAQFSEVQRGLNAREVHIENISNQVQFEFYSNQQFFSEIASIRAMRELISRCCELGEISVKRVCDFQIHVNSSTTYFSKMDPWMNILRNTSSCMSALMCGVNSIAPVAFDSKLKKDRKNIDNAISNAKELSLNTYHILCRESHLPQVIDPMGGSWFIEKMTEQYIDRAWKQLESFSSAPSFLEALEKIDIRSLIESHHQRVAEYIDHRKIVFAGINDYVNTTQGYQDFDESNKLDMHRCTQEAYAPLVQELRDGWQEHKELTLKLWELIESYIMLEGSIPKIFQLMRVHSDEIKGMELAQFNPFSFFEDYRLSRDAHLAVYLLGDETKLSARVMFCMNLLELTKAKVSLVKRDDLDKSELSNYTAAILVCSDFDYENYLHELKDLPVKCFIAGAKGKVDDEELEKINVGRVYQGMNLKSFLEVLCPEEVEK